MQSPHHSWVVCSIGAAVDVAAGNVHILSRSELRFCLFSTACRYRSGFRGFVLSFSTPIHFPHGGDSASHIHQHRAAHAQGRQFLWGWDSTFSNHNFPVDRGHSACLDLCGADNMHKLILQPFEVCQEEIPDCLHPAAAYAHNVTRKICDDASYIAINNKTVDVLSEFGTQTPAKERALKYNCFLVLKIS